MTPILALQAAPIPATIAERSVRENKIAAATDTAAAALAARYLRGNPLDNQTLSCIQALEESGNFLFAFQRQLFSQSLARLRTSGSPVIQNFLRLYDRHFPEGTLPSFRFTGHVFGPSPADLPAGFQRGGGSLFFDLSRIHPSDWLVILVHELFHAVDDELYAAVTTYSDRALVAQVVRLSQAHDHWRELGAAPSETLRTWLNAGLGRGLFAEWRAWAATVAVYEAGRPSGLFGEVSWLAPLDRHGSVDLQAIYAALDSRSPAPEAMSLFAHPLLREGEAEIRREMRIRRTLPSPGALREILAP